MVLNRRPKYDNGDWVWVDDKTTTTGGGSHVLKEKEAGQNKKSFAFIAKLSLCWTGHFKILLVGPGTTNNAGRKVRANLLLVEVQKDHPGKQINARVSIHRCKKCF